MNSESFAVTMWQSYRFKNIIWARPMHSVSLTALFTHVIKDIANSICTQIFGKHALFKQNSIRWKEKIKLRPLTVVSIPCFFSSLSLSLSRLSMCLWYTETHLFCLFECQTDGSVIEKFDSSTNADFIIKSDHCVS